MDVEIRPPSNDKHNLVIFILTANVNPNVGKKESKIKP
jgi:hypothetical protein